MMEAKGAHLFRGPKENNEVGKGCSKSPELSTGSRQTQGKHAF